VFALALLALGGCGGHGPPLVGTEWTVTAVRTPDDRTIPAPTRATIAFHADGTITGNLGCNGYGGHWDGHARLTGDIVQTEMACAGSPDWAELASALAAPGRVDRDGAQLTVTTDTGARVFAEPTDVTRLLAGHTYAVDAGSGMDGGTRRIASAATLTFAGDGRAYGALDCGAWTGDWRVDGGSLVVTRFAALPGGCGHRDRVPQLEDLLAGPLRVDLSRSGRRLWLTAADGRALGAGRTDTRPSPMPVCSEPAAPDIPEFAGLDLADAAALAGRRGVSLRLVCDDGRSQARTADLRPDRVNLVLTRGRVSRAYAG
jgi:heat shock protein HslJ